VLYGAGKRCRRLLEYINEIKYSEFIVVDSNSEKYGMFIDGHAIYSPEIIGKHQNIRLCITIGSKNDRTIIRNQICSIYQECEIEEISYNSLLLELIKQVNLVKKDTSLKLLNGTEQDFNVLFDCYSGLVLGGVESWTINVCEELLNNGKITPYIICKDGEWEVPDIVKEQVIPVDIDLANRFSIRNISNIINAILPKLPCKVVTCTTDEVMMAAYLIRRAYPNEITILSVVHNSNDNVYEAYKDFKECTDIYIGVSQDISKKMVEYGIADTQVYTIICPFKCDKILKRTYTEDYSKPICIGYAGRMDGMEKSQKRMDLMLKLIKELADRKVNFKFELAGDGMARNEMEHFIRTHHYEDRVSFLGRLERDDIPTFWKRQDILANCSDYEGHSIMQLEAMANGAVPVVTEVSGVHEDITYGENGYYVPIGDCFALADRIEYLSRHRELLPVMGKKAHDAVYPKSSMETHVKFLEELLKKD
jgi:glycosyltransferase involved in cell wall biosynthesis